jgi:hypothetical protein
MLLIWAVAVFGFQFLLRAIEKPTPEKTLQMFETTWPVIKAGDYSVVDYQVFLKSLVLVRGKTSMKTDDKMVISNAISTVTFKVLPDSIKAQITTGITDLDSLQAQITRAKDQEYLDIKTKIGSIYVELAGLCEPYTGFKSGSLEAVNFYSSLKGDSPESFNDNAFVRLPEIMTLYLTHNQSILTDTIFLGFPFHYFYTAVFLLILFVALCIVYNVLIEWRLKKEGIVE